MRRGSVLGDMQMGARFGAVQATAPTIYQAPPSNSGVGEVTSPTLSTGVAEEIARNVQQIPYSDSISASYPLECFFVMPVGVVRIRSIKVYAQRDEFRRYVQAVSASSAGGGGTVTSGGGGGGTSSTVFGYSVTTTSGGSLVGGADPSSTGGAGSTTDAQGVHNHSETGSITSSDGSHAHNVNSHSHTLGHSHPLPDHQHAVAVAQHNHTTDVHSHGVDTSHNHTITTTLTPGIFEEVLSGTISLFVDNTGLGTAYAGPISSGSGFDGVDVTGYFTRTPGARRIKIEGTALMRVHVLIVLDLVLELGI